MYIYIYGTIAEPSPTARAAGRVGRHHRRAWPVMFLLSASRGRSHGS